jgi:hypothetical protein
VYRAAKQYDKNKPQPVIPKTVTSPSGPFDYPAGAKVVPPAPPVATSKAPPPAAAAKPAAKPAAPAAAASAAPVPAAALIDPLAGLTALDTKAPTVEDSIAAAKKLGDDTEVRKKLEEYVASQKETGEKSIKAFETGIAALPKSYEKYEARLQKEEAEAATDKQKAMGMSIFKAGLAMMSGTSQNAFENIGKGAMVGLEDQQAALKDFKKAQRERDKAFADIEASRLADQRGDLKTKLELENRAADRNASAQGKMIDGIAKLFDTNTTNARGIYTIGLENVNRNKSTMYTTGADIGKQRMADATALQRQRDADAAALERTRMQANALSPEERVLSNDKLFGRKMQLTAASAGVRGDTALKEAWAKSPYLQTQYPNVDDYVRMMSGSSGTAGGEFKVLGSRPAP